MSSTPYNAADWVRDVDGDGNEYYYNVRTNESRWTLPSPAPSPSSRRQQQAQSQTHSEKVRERQLQRATSSDSRTRASPPNGGGGGGGGEETFNSSREWHRFNARKRTTAGNNKCMVDSCVRNAELYMLCLQHYFDAMAVEQAANETRSTAKPTPHIPHAIAEGDDEGKQTAAATGYDDDDDDNGNYDEMADSREYEQSYSSREFRQDRLTANEVYRRATMAIGPGVAGGGASPPGTATQSRTASMVSSASENGANTSARLLAEVVSSEKSYLGGLKAIDRSFLRRLKAMCELNRPMLSNVEIAQCFQNLDQVLDLSRRLYQELRQLRNNNQLTKMTLGDTLSRFSPFFKLYQTYVLSYETANEHMLAYRKKRVEFARFCEVGEKVEGYDLASLLITPIQRLPRYALLLQGLLKNSDPDTEADEVASLTATLSKITTITADINASFHLREARNRVISIQSHIAGIDDLVTPTRYWIRDGPLKKLYNNKWHVKDDKKYWFFLFDDLLLYTTVPSKSSGDCTLKHMLPLETISVDANPISTVDKVKIPEHAFWINGEPKSFLVYAATASEKDLWVQSLTTAITKLQAKRSSRNIRFATSPRNAAAAAAAAVQSFRTPPLSPQQQQQQQQQQPDYARDWSREEELQREKRGPPPLPPHRRLPLQQ